MLVAALGCALMMGLALAGFAWYAGRSDTSSGDEYEVGALRAEIAKLRQQQPETSGEKFGRRG